MFTREANVENSGVNADNATAEHQGRAESSGGTFSLAKIASDQKLPQIVREIP